MINGIKEVIFKEIRSRIVNEVRNEQRSASERKLRAIVRAYESLPFYLRHFDLPCLDQELWFKRRLRYAAARDVLNHTFSWEDFEKKEEEERILKQTKKEEEIVRQERIKNAKGIDLFIGSLSEYERMKGEEYQIVRVEGRENVISYGRNPSTEWLEKLGAMDIDGLIRFTLFSGYLSSQDGYGIPVRKAKKT